MPQVVVGAALAAAGTAVSAAIAGTAITAGMLATSFLGSLVLGGLSYALTPKPKKPAFSAIETSSSTVAIRQPDLTRQHVYGHTRVTRGYAHMESTGANGKLHMILMLSEGPLRAINEVWINDYAIPNDWIDVNGNVTQGRYANKLVIRKHLGSDDQVADSLAVSNMLEWTSQHRLRGVAYLYLIMTKDQDVYPTGVPNISAIVEGPLLYDPRYGENSWSTNIALYASDFLKNNRYGFGAFDDDVDDVNVSAQANICDEIVDTEFKDYEVLSVASGSDIITLKGEILELQFGDRVQVSSTGTLPGGLTEDTDYYVIPYQIKDTPRILLAESLEESMSKTDIDITSAGSGVITIRKTGEPRYHGSGLIDTESNLSETMNNIVTCMAGRAVNIGGKWSLLAGAWRTPAITYNIGDVRSSYGVKNALSMGEAYNSVSGLFVGPLSYYQPTNYPVAEYQSFIDADNGLYNPRELNLPFTTRPTTAQRIAKIELFRGRQDIVYKSDFSMKAIQSQPGDVVEFDLARLGWEEKEFEITDFVFDLNNGNIVTKMTLRETAQAIYDWSSGEAIDFDPAPNTSLPDPFNVVVPTGVSYNSRTIGTRDADEIFALTLAWGQHANAFVLQDGDFEIQYKRSNETEWRPSFFVDGSLTNTDVVNATVNEPYDLRIRARNNLGVRSNWVTILNAVAGSSGGVGVTADWETFSDSVSIYKDWALFSDSVSATEDWGYFT